MIAQHSSESVEWFTPLEVLIPAQKYLEGEFLDPASCLKANKKVKAAKIFTEDQDGLRKKWPDMPVFCNPPGGTRTSSERYPTRSNIVAWYLKVSRHHKETGQRCIFVGFSLEVLVTLQRATDSQPSMICIPDHRIRFEHAENDRQSPTHGNVIIGFGDFKAFSKCFRNLGMIYKEGA